MAKRAHRDHRAAGRKVADETPPTGLERLFTVEQIARTGARCRASLYHDIKVGRLKAIKFGRSTRISESAYRAYLEAAPALSPAP